MPIDKIIFKLGGYTPLSACSRWPFIILGLTGSIGMGKSTTSNLLKVMNVPVFDSDRVIHSLLLGTGRAFQKVAERFPNVVFDGIIDRKKLGSIVFHDSAARRDLETLLYPMLLLEREKFFKFHSLNRSRLVVLDAPLLYEKRLDTLCDYILVMTAPSFVQSQRVLSRVGMSVDKYNAILKSQMSDSTKRFLASKVIFSGLGRHTTWRRLVKTLSDLRK